MAEEADRFRSRARQCRKLARDAHDEASRQTLSAMAKDLDAEADIIEAEDATKEGES